MNRKLDSFKFRLIFNSRPFECQSVWTLMHFTFSSLIDHLPPKSCLISKIVLREIKLENFIFKRTSWDPTSVIRRRKKFKASNDGARNDERTWEEYRWKKNKKTKFTLKKKHGMECWLLENLDTQTRGFVNERKQPVRRKRKTFFITFVVSVYIPIVYRVLSPLNWVTRSVQSAQGNENNFILFRSKV